jgi:hypothetical protein
MSEHKSSHNHPVLTSQDSSVSDVSEAKAAHQAHTHAAGSKPAAAGAAEAKAGKVQSPGEAKGPGAHAADEKKSGGGAKGNIIIFLLRYTLVRHCNKSYTR